MDKISFGKAAQTKTADASRRIGSDTFYVFEATVEKGVHYDDIAAQLQQAVGDDLEKVDDTVLGFIGAFQKPGLTLSSKLENLWLLFNGSSNTTSGAYAIVADLDDAQVNLFEPSHLGPLGSLIPGEAEAALRLKRLVYSHNLAPAKFGTDILGGAGNLVLDWPFGFNAGMVVNCELSFAGVTTEFSLVYSVPGGYSARGTAKAAALDQSGAKEVAQQAADQRKKEKEEGGPRRPLKSVVPHARFGPVSLDSVLVTLKGMSVEIDVTASVELGPMEGRLIDFQVELFLDHLSRPRFDIGGVGVAYEQDALSIAGALLFQKMTYEDGGETKTTEAFNGGLLIKTPAMGFSAIASIAEIEVDDEAELSLFLYAMLQLKTGISIFEVVTINGAALTLGYNRDFLVPSDTSDIASHPLIALVGAGGPPKTAREKEEAKRAGRSIHDKSGTDESGGRKGDAGKDESPLEFDSGGDLDTLLSVLRNLKDFVPIKPHNMVAGAGLMANLVQLVDLFLIPVVSFNVSSGGVSIQLFGTASMALPKGAKGDAVVMRLNAAMAAEIPVSAGDKPLMVGLSITDGSFVLRRELKLGGGLAIYHFKGVTLLTIGGYGPLYRGVKPGWPVVAPVSLSLQIKKKLGRSSGENDKGNRKQPEGAAKKAVAGGNAAALALKGTLYFSLLPDGIAFGLGAKGTATLSGSHFKVGASFDFGLDALMMWAPFFYEIEAHARFRLHATASLIVSRFGIGFSVSKTLSFDLSAGLRMWGNNVETFNGRAELTVHLLLTFHPTVDWGEPIANFAPISWDEFNKQFAPQTVPPEKNETPRLVSGQCHITNGVLRFAGPDDTAIVSAEHLVAESRVFFPPTRWTVNDQHSGRIGSNRVGIQMIGMAAEDYSAPMTVTLKRESVEVDTAGCLDIEVITGNVPAALWKPAKHTGMADKPDQAGPQTIDDVPLGLRIRPRAPSEGVTHTVDKRTLAFDVNAGPQVRYQPPGRTQRGRTGTQAEVITSMNQNRPDPAVLAALGIDGTYQPFAPVGGTDLVGDPHLV